MIHQTGLYIQYYTNAGAILFLTLLFTYGLPLLPTVYDFVNGYSSFFILYHLSIHADRPKARHRLFSV